MLSNTIILNGPAGIYEIEKFCKVIFHSIFHVILSSKLPTEA
ncbi:MAG: hypothetical protein PF439_10700 [Helicobacteraceae bacterium]|nr:hypothetical protein [Helicobacteraceae bacterium]